MIGTLLILSVNEYHILKGISINLLTLDSQMDNQLKILNLETGENSFSGEIQPSADVGKSL